MNEISKISAGSFDLNKWLYGGYEKDIISMIAGPPGSGKTNFCILAACSQAKKGNKVLFIDTEGGFSTSRIKQIVGEDYEKVLGNILLLGPTNFEEQKKIILDLPKKVKKEHFNLIVIDGMAMLYRLELGDAVQSKDEELIKEVNRDVAHQMRALAEISRKQNIPIVITNQVYSNFIKEGEKNTGTRLVGGDLFRYWSKCIIELRNENSRKKAILLKHRSLPQRELNFEIRNMGIYKRGWI
jgi:DNA repair protein RadB